MGNPGSATVTEGKFKHALRFHKLLVFTFYKQVTYHAPVLEGHLPPTYGELSLSFKMGATIYTNNSANHTVGPA